MNIKIVGMGCSKCKVLEENVKKAIKEMELEVNIEKVNDIKEIAKYGVLMPALLIDGKIVSSGKVLSVKEIKNLILKE